ncbi:glycophorin-A isoform X2 [Antechinus flavipes]|uniref:glycophorin-A isoform X2 n=1 Tax=Antechinus flavipes TaxID=38775 RepID=UPI0022361AA1|nr:glycophorin-A isoform X2 [Antechinus flavipes]
MYEEIVLLLLLLDNVSTQDLSVNKTNTFLPLTSPKPSRNHIDEELPVTEEPGYNFTSVIPQKPLRRSRTAEVPVTAYPGDISIEETTTHKTSTSLPVTSQKPTIHQRRKETDTVRTTEGYVSTQDPSDPEEQAATQGPAHTTEHMNIITYHNLRTSSPTEESVKYGPKGRIIHKLSGPVITVIVFAVIAGIIGVILFGSVLVRRLTTRNH